MLHLYICKQVAFKHIVVNTAKWNTSSQNLPFSEMVVTQYTAVTHRKPNVFQRCSVDRITEKREIGDDAE